jgi:hypothetical protein
LVDAGRVADRPRGRLPEGTGRWLFADVATPGAENHFALHDEIVINEIMYHYRWQLAPLPIPAPATAQAFDFGPADAPVGEGYVGIGTDGYTVENGYGWTDGSLSEVDGGTAAALHRDLVTITSPSAGFAVDLSNGTYYVTVLMGDLKKVRDQM